MTLNILGGTAGPGSRSKLMHCRVCANSGFPHEAVVYATDSNRRDQHLILLNYYDGKIHVHRGRSLAR